MRKLLVDLAKSKIVKVTGSYADGTNTDESDIDFFVTPDHPEASFSERNMLKIISILDRYRIKWQSTIPGYIFTHRTTGNGHLQCQLEFSDLFLPRENKLARVEIDGVQFMTY